MIAANANTSVEFRRCHPKTAAWEGGWSNHKADPGGKTMYGVTEVKFHEWLDKHGKPRRPVRSITKAEAEQLYFEEFWTRAGCEDLFPGVNLATYDASVNSGVSRGRKWLLASLDKSDRHDRTVKTLCAKRLGFMQSLNIWKTFGKGWGNRVADIEATGVAWALAAMTANDNAQVTTALRDEASTARKTAVRQGTSAGGSATAGSASATGLAVDPANVDQAAGWLLSGLLVAGLLVAGYLVIRAVINSKRAEAYARVAEQTAVTGEVA